MLVLGCGGPPPCPGTDILDGQFRICDPSPYEPAWVEQHILYGLNYWQGSRDDVAGYELVFVDGPFPCDPYPDSLCLGLHQGKKHRITVARSSCPAGTIVHEVGHAVIGDNDHLDPLWLQLAFACRFPL